MSLLAPRSELRTSTWEEHGLLDNPFRPAGFGVDYDAHIESEISQLSTWLREVTTRPRPRPLAIKGSIGIGKTHLLKRVQADLRAAGEGGARVLGSYLTVTGSGARNLQLGTLLLEAMRSPLPWAPPGPDFPIVDEILSASSKLKNHSTMLRSALKAAHRGGPDAVQALRSWLAQRELTKKEQERIGVTGRLHGEGEAVRVFADLCRVAAETTDFKVWVVMIDQLEDLWRPNEVTPIRRARFLTDLRTLVDEALSGAPAALLMAWNTEVSSRMVDSLLKQDYAALSSRLGTPIDLPRLPGEHAEPFAQAYVDAAHQQFRARRPKAGSSAVPAALKVALNEHVPNLAEATRRREGTGAFGQIPRLWLESLRDWADKWIQSAGQSRRARRG